ncbi:hypothetical protein ACFPMF_22170 [Larkinella bovis]|uniref:Uncharacterized protein n=1 Tax=Larkinella bovis TaxID=683041 RepID=A0ABW0IIP4_9BACT
MRATVYLWVVLMASVLPGLAQDQFLSKPLSEVKAQLDKKRISYSEQLSPMGDVTTLSYSATEVDSKRIDLFFTHSLTFPQANKNLCSEVVSLPMLQKAWVADTIKNRLLIAGFKKLDDSRYVNERFNLAATLDYIKDSQQPTVRMLRILFKPIKPKANE